MPLVTQYHVLIYGSSAGYQGTRSQISLYSNPQTTVAFVRFIDQGVTFPADAVVGGRILMHLPASMFHPTLDMLRNEKPINVYFAQNRGFLGTGDVEPIGEGEQ
jgi:hypothetical protein